MCPPLSFRPKKSYFFSGVLAAGGVVGLAFTSAFSSSVFFSSDFFSSLAGLGLTVADGLEVGAGEATVTGVEVGVVTGLFCTLVSVQAAEIAAIAAKTVSRIDLLIVVSLFIGR